MTTMEDLTKTQIVLLTLLVSFITSIATGIITTSLLAQAPQNVTQTIDRVVEHTIQQVAPSSTGSTKEVTIVKEDDAIVSSISESSGSIVRVKTPPDVTGLQSFYALGVVVDKSGLILTDKRDINPNSAYTVVFSDNSTSQASVYKVSDTGSLVLLKLPAGDAHLKNLTPLTVSRANPQLGQTVIAIEGRERTSIAVGRVLSIVSDTGTAATDIPPQSEEPGSPLLDLSGELVGFKASNNDLSLPPGAYLMSTVLNKFISS